MLSCFSHVWLFATLWTIAYQAPLSIGFSRQEYWSGLPWLPPGDLPDPMMEPHISFVFCIGRQILYHSATWKALSWSPAANPPSGGLKNLRFWLGKLPPEKCFYLLSQFLSPYFLWSLLQLKPALSSHACVLSHVQLFVTPRTVACQGPLSVEFSPQEYRRGLPFPLPGGLSDPGIKSAIPISSSLAGRFFATEPPGNSPSNHIFLN